NNKYLYSSGMGNPKMVVLKDEGGASLTFQGYITLPQPGAARQGISPVAPGGRLWINGADDGFPPPTLINYDGTVIAIIPDSLASRGGTSCVKHLILGDYNLVTVTNAWGLSIRSVRFFEDELGTITFGYFGTNCDSIPILYNGNTFINNVNATSSLAYDSKRHAIFSLFGFNSITSLSLDSLLKASTPRKDNLEISINGKNDFFPTDYVGSSNGRDMFLTWSEGKVYVGVTGYTLIDATEKNRMYVAFDLDPDGANGSTIPPENAGGVSSLPFKADVVFMVEPFNTADYMLGNIYKWNGSAWAFTQFDGNFASQGALAFADEGDRKLAEFAAIKNDPGIGEKFTKVGIMVYVAEKDASGNVLCAFPPGNPIGNGVAFGRYYYADELGSGMFPADTMFVKLRGFATAVHENNKPTALPDKFVLHQNYPNPFNPETTISYELPKSAFVSIEIYDITGRLIEKLLNEKQSAGRHNLKFSADQLSSGIYFYRLTADKNVLMIKKLIVLR
ncbi:MAG TPA: T9SS type A sorting domain-containing protein, partial [bacterium]